MDSEIEFELVDMCRRAIRSTFLKSWNLTAESPVWVSVGRLKSLHWEAQGSALQGCRNWRPTSKGMGKGWNSSIEGSTSFFFAFLFYKLQAYWLLVSTSGVDLPPQFACLHINHPQTLPEFTTDRQLLLKLCWHITNNDHREWKLWVKIPGDIIWVPVFSYI